jgi:hypothetical protein
MGDSISPNWFAYVALLSWPLVTLVLFRVMPVVGALLWTILGAQMFLPELTELKVQMLPQIDKTSIASICAFVGCAVVARRSPVRGGSGIVAILLVMYLVGPVITSALNGDIVQLGVAVLPGVGVYDGVSASITQFFLIIPFFLGRRYVSGPGAIESILRVLVIAGLIYSLPMLFEVRMSPQLHRWVYGFSSSNMITEGRFGGYRPVVFMGIGLIASFFLLTTIIAAAALWRVGASVTQLPGGVVTGYLSIVLLLSKSSGALLYGLIILPVVRLARPRLQMILAIVLVSVVLTYPAIRFFEFFPEQELVQLATDFDSDRGFSLKTRFKNENQLLARASERILFGWGRYGRNRIYSDYDGRDESLTDGLWIITLGTWGVFGFIAQFGLLALVVFRAASTLQWVTSREQFLLSALALICGITMFEQLPNASIRPWTWLVAGALLGRCEVIRVRSLARNGKS